MCENYISRLPIELMLMVVAYLDIYSISFLSRTCKGIGLILQSHRPAILADLCVGIYSQEFQLWYSEKPSFRRKVLDRPRIGRAIQNLCAFEAVHRTMGVPYLKGTALEDLGASELDFGLPAAAVAETIICNSRFMVSVREDMLRQVLDCTIPCIDHVQFNCFDCFSFVAEFDEEEDEEGFEPLRNWYERNNTRFKPGTAQHKSWEEMGTVNSMLYRLDDIQTRIADIVAMIQSACADQQHLLPSKEDLHTAVLVHLTTITGTLKPNYHTLEEYLNLWNSQYRILYRVSKPARVAYTKFLKILEAVFTKKWGLLPWTEAAKNSGHSENSDKRCHVYFDNYQRAYVFLALVTYTISELCVFLSEPARDEILPPCCPSCVLRDLDFRVPQPDRTFHRMNNQVSIAMDPRRYYRMQMMHFIHLGIAQTAKYTQLFTWHAKSLNKVLSLNQGQHREAKDPLERDNAGSCEWSGVT